MMPCPGEQTLVEFVERGAEGTPELEAHLDECDACRAAVVMLASMAKGEETSADGQLLAGRFVLGEVLGAGGLGLVIAAHDLRLGADIAIKLLRPDQPRSFERLDAEVRLARRVRHPNVCAVFDLEHDGDRRFITMERVIGETLPEWFARTRPGVRKCQEIMRQIADGVAAAHAEGVVHRDLKPSNVMIDSGDRVRILDFGLAIDRRSAETVAGRAGTPRWWAPEQARGEPATARTDVYAIGAIGAWIFGADRVWRDRWISVALRPDPAARYPDARALRRAIGSRQRWVRAIAAAAVLTIAVMLSVDRLSTPEPTPDAQIPRRPSVALTLPMAADALRHLMSARKAMHRHAIAPAIVELEAVVELLPDLVEARVWLAYGLDWLGARARALAETDQAILRLDALETDDRLFLLSLSAKLAHDPDRAIHLLDALLAHTPRHAAGRFMRADLDFHAGRFPAALDGFEGLVGDAPTLARAWNHLLWASFAVFGPSAAEAVAERWSHAPGGARGARHYRVLIGSVGDDPRQRAAITALGQADPFDMLPPTLESVLALEAGGDPIAPLARFAHASRGSAGGNVSDAWRRMGWMHAARGRADATGDAYAIAEGWLLDHLSTWRTPHSNRILQLQAEEAWLRASLGLDDRVPPAALARQPDLYGDISASRDLALACLLRDDLRCTATMARSGWPIVASIERAHRVRRQGHPAAAAELMRSEARRASPSMAPSLWLAASLLAGEAGDIVAADADLRRAAAWRFASPQSVVARVIARRHAVGER